MSMPQHFSIVVISNALMRGGEIAGSVATLIGASESEIRPYIVPAAAHARCRLALAKAMADRGLILWRAVPPHFLDARSIDLWLVLDSGAETIARRLIRESGPPPGGFYRLMFPDAVQRFGSHIPSPKQDLDFKKWLDDLERATEVWRERIWKAFSDSS